MKFLFKESSEATFLDLLFLSLKLHKEKIIYCEEATCTFKNYLI